MLFKISEVIKYSDRNKAHVTEHAFLHCKFSSSHFDVVQSLWEYDLKLHF